MSEMAPDLVTELVELVEAYHRALDERGGPATQTIANELAVRHGRVQIAMRDETEWSGFEREPEAVAA